MPSRRNQISLTDEEQKQFLEDSWTLQVASIGPGGYPHLVAMWYVLDDEGRIVFTTFRKSQKVLNLQRDKKMTVMVEAGKKYTELKGLVIEGEVDILDDPENTARVMARVGEKYNGIPARTDTPEAALKVASKRVVVRLNPVDVYSWDHSKLGGVY
jgi:PPOX class probable F420-dependent enzyme